MEMSLDDQNVIVLTDPAARTQYVIMPDDRMYMQMPIGQGPINIRVSGSMDPTNPCSTGTATDCVRGGTESVNGYETVRWDYTSDGKQTTSWISTRYRFPIKTTDESGGLTEFRNIAEGPQPATLFALPSGYRKMDVGAMGGMGMPNPGRAAGPGNPMAGMTGMPGMENLPPEARAALAAAMSSAQGPRGVTGSAWEKGKGWILNVTISTSGSSARTAPETGIRVADSFSGKYTASIPLNYGTPGVGTPGAPGPMWTHLASEGAGSPEALAAPLTFTAETQSRTETNVPKGCPIDDGQTIVTTSSSRAQARAAVLQPTPELMAQAIWKLSPDLKTYELVVGIGGANARETVNTRTAIDPCMGPPRTEDKSETREVGHGFQAVNLTGFALPATVSTVAGSRQMPISISGRDVDATVSWTLTPIR